MLALKTPYLLIRIEIMYKFTTTLNNNNKVSLGEKCDTCTDFQDWMSIKQNQFWIIIMNDHYFEMNMEDLHGIICIRWLLIIQNKPAKNNKQACLNWMEVSICNMGIGKVVVDFLDAFYLW